MRIPRKKANIHDLLRAINVGEFKQLEEAVKRGADINNKFQGTTPLSLTIYGNKEDMFTLLLNHGADVNQKSKDHNDRVEPPLVTVCRLGREAMLQPLIRFGADINQTDTFGQSPLWYAVKEQRLEFIKTLINCGACLNSATTWAECPLYLAAKYLPYKGRKQVVKLLIQHGCKLDVVDYFYRPPIYWTLFAKDFDSFKLFLAAGSKLEPDWLWEHEKKKPWDFKDYEEFMAAGRIEQTNPRSLQSLCRTTIRKHLSHVGDGKSIVNSVNQLPIPKPLIQYINLDII